MAEETLPQPDEIIELACRRHTGSTGRAHVYLAQAEGPAPRALRYPILVVEGFPGGYPQEYLLGRLNQHGLMEDLRARGYDILVISLDQGSSRIQHSAGVVEDCIFKLIKRGTDPLVVGGLSMGGLVARYALTRLEHEGVEHHTRAYFSWDSPHQGAYTSLAAQWLVQQYRHASPEAEANARLLDSVANQQIVKLWLHDNQVGESPLRREFLNELQRLGNYPQKTQRWAMASGAGTGGRRAPAHQLAVDCPDDSRFGCRLWTLGEGGVPALIAEGQWQGQPRPSLHVTSPICWESVPGAQGDHLVRAALVASALSGRTVPAQVTRYTSVPTFSTLDVQGVTDPYAALPPRQRGDGQVFHEWIAAETDQPHLGITAAMRDWFIQRLEHFDAHDPDYLRNPYPTYARLRRTAGVSKVAPYDSWWVFRDADVRAAVADAKRFAKNPPKGMEPLPRPPFDLLDNLPDGPFGSDGDWHQTLRTVLDEPFKQIVQDAPAVARTVAQALLKDFPESGRVELVSAYALPLPAQVLFHVLGIPDGARLPGQDISEADAHRKLLIGWVTAIANAHDITQSLGTQMMGATCGMALGNYFQALLRRTPSNPPRGMVDRLIAQADAPGGLTREQVQSSLVSMTVAGYLSTTFLICTGVQHLLANPEQIPLLLADDEEYDGRLLKELLRLDAAAQIVDRVTQVEVTLSGVTIPAGEKVALILGSANRDPERFDDPDRLNVGRPNLGKHLSFGDGIHRCLGEPLARRVAPVALRELFRKLGSIQVDGIVQWQTDPYLRGATSFPVSWSVGKRA